MSEIQAKAEKSLIPAVMNETDLRSLVYVIRGQQVMLDSDLAALYQVETKVFNQAVSRNIERFPENFRFQLTAEEYTSLRSQFVTSNGRGGRRYLPYGAGDCHAVRRTAQRCRGANVDSHYEHLCGDAPLYCQQCAAV